MLFRTLLVVDGVIALVLLFTFYVGLAEGSVSSFNGALWLIILFGIAAIIGLSMRLHSRGNTLVAKLLLMTLAGPGLGGGMFALTLLILQPTWN